jgi:hypothetical protein
MENYIQLVKNPAPFTVQGFEALSIGESFSLFFKEINTSVDRRLAALSKSVHKVDIGGAENNVKTKKLLFVKHSGVQLLTPQGYRSGMANMASHSKAVCGGVYIISSLKTEASRLYHWLKQILKSGRLDTSFRWTVTDFDQALGQATNFIKNLPDQDRQSTFAMGQVYVSFEEFFEVASNFNNAVNMLNARDIELTAKELSNVYDLGSILVAKIHANDIVLAETAISDIESVVNRFVELTNIAGAMMVLLNELTAVFTDQAKTISKL